MRVSVIGDRRVGALPFKFVANGVIVGVAVQRSVSGAVLNRRAERGCRAFGQVRITDAVTNAQLCYGKVGAVGGNTDAQFKSVEHDGKVVRQLRRDAREQCRKYRGERIGVFAPQRTVCCRDVDFGGRFVILIQHILFVERQAEGIQIDAGNGRFNRLDCLVNVVIVADRSAVDQVGKLRSGVKIACHERAARAAGRHLDNMEGVPCRVTEILKHIQIVRSVLADPRHIHDFAVLHERRFEVNQDAVWQFPAEAARRAAQVNRRAVGGDLHGCLAGFPVDGDGCARFILCGGGESQHEIAVHIVGDGKVAELVNLIRPARTAQARYAHDFARGVEDGDRHAVGQLIGRIVAAHMGCTEGAGIECEILRVDADQSRSGRIPVICAFQLHQTRGRARCNGREVRHEAHRAVGVADRIHIRARDQRNIGIADARLFLLDIDLSAGAYLFDGQLGCRQVQCGDIRGNGRSRQVDFADIHYEADRDIDCAARFNIHQRGTRGFSHAHHSAV